MSVQFDMNNSQCIFMSSSILLECQEQKDYIKDDENKENSTLTASRLTLMPLNNIGKLNRQYGWN